MNKGLKFLTGLMIAGAIGTCSYASAKTGSINAFDVTYQGPTVYTGKATQATTKQVGYIDLTNDSGTAYITSTMYNSEGAYRGQTTAQRGKKVDLKHTGTQWYEYKLGLVKTNPGNPVRVVGTWSPDK